MEDRTITLYNDKGEEIKCEILFTYHSEEFNKSYVVLKLPNRNECSAYSYDEKDATSGELHQIESEEEWKMLEDLLEDYYNQPDEEENACKGCAKAGCCGGDCSCE